MAYTQEQLAAITEAIAQGALIVEYGDKKVEYRSLAEMERIKMLMEVELNPQRQSGRRVGVFSKNWQRNGRNW